MAIAIDGTSESPSAKEAARKMSAAFNAPTGGGAWIPRPEEYKVYLYTVAHRELVAEHALLGQVQIPACPKGERYRKVRFIPHPFPQRVEDVFQTGREPFDYHSGERIAQDICNPSNPTLDQTIDDYGRIDPFFAVQEGVNFANYGVFWSKNSTPTEEEVERATTRRDNFYRRLIQNHDRIFSSDPASAAEFGPDIRMALDYFGEQREYHRKFIAKMLCQNCGSEIPATAAFHYLPNGVVCVLDWDRAIEAGVKTEDDRPGAKKRRAKDTPEAA